MFKKFVLAVTLALALAACTTAGAIISGSVDNPLTPKVALQLHTSFVAGVVVPAAAYAKLPRCSRAPAPCSEQTVVNQLRTYVNAADALLKKLDQWALGNTALDGPALFRAATIAIQTAQSYAAAQGVK